MKSMELIKIKDRLGELMNNMAMWKGWNFSKQWGARDSKYNRYLKNQEWFTTRLKQEVDENKNRESERI